MNLPSKTLEAAVEGLASLPGIGRKTALRLVLHLLREGPSSISLFTAPLHDLHTKIKYCRECHNISDGDICSICSSSYRDESIVCVVEDLRDVIAIENTGQYQGRYHVLGGVISPLEGVGPENLTIDSLLKKSSILSELIFALPSTMEGDTTAFYITRKLKDYNLKISSLARGIPIGGELEYADEITLGRSILERVNYNR